MTKHLQTTHPPSNKYHMRLKIKHDYKNEITFKTFDIKNVKSQMIQYRQTTKKSFYKRAIKNKI